MTVERDAATAMADVAAAMLRDVLFGYVHGHEMRRELSEHIAAAVLRAGLRELAAHQLRTPSDLPAQSLVAWLRTVASELGDTTRADAVPASYVHEAVDIALGRSDAVQDAITTPHTAPEPSGSGEIPNATVAAPSVPAAPSWPQYRIGVLVHGANTDRAHVVQCLDGLHERQGIKLVQVPPDTPWQNPARLWAARRNVEEWTFAGWTGPNRPDMVIVFEDTPNASALIREAQQAGVPVLLPVPIQPVEDMATMQIELRHHHT